MKVVTPGASLPEVCGIGSSNIERSPIESAIVLPVGGLSLSNIADSVNPGVLLVGVDISNAATE